MKTPPTTCSETVAKVLPVRFTLEPTDAEKYAEIGRQLTSHGVGLMDSAEFQALWKEREDIKNRHGGMPPTISPQLNINQ